jgi:hypothetical protein
VGWRHLSLERSEGRTWKTMFDQEEHFGLGGGDGDGRGGSAIL